jgi:hypothetical protein
MSLEEGETDDGTMIVYDEKEISGSKGGDNKVKAIINGINNIKIESPKSPNSTSY